MVIYPRPKDVDAFEKIYQSEHIPLAVAKLSGQTKIVATKVLSSPQGTPAFYRIAEVYFPSMKALEACAASEDGKEVLAHAVKFRWNAAVLDRRGRNIHVRLNADRIEGQTRITRLSP
jgi:uncharacterized protein (TIGR02118 family)